MNTAALMGAVSSMLLMASSLSLLAISILNRPRPKIDPPTQSEKDFYVKKCMMKLEAETWKRMDYTKTFFYPDGNGKVRECYMQKYKDRDFPLPKDNVCFVGEGELTIIRTRMLKATREEAQAVIDNRALKPELELKIIPWQGGYKLVKENSI